MRALGWQSVMNAGQLRTVSYGDAKDRQVRPGMYGAEGADNRRVALAIDYSGTAGSQPEQPMTPTEPPAPTDQPAPPPDSQPSDESSPPTGQG